MTTNRKALLLHEEWKGKLKTASKVKVASREDLALAYAPGVAEPRRVIAADPEAAYRYTIKSNTIAIVSDGNAVLGPGNTGPLTAVPVIEGKAMLFKGLGGINAFPICLDTQNTQGIIEAVVRIAPAFGGINLEDVSAPRCFEVEEALRKRLDIPVFHDDQHSTTIVALVGVINSLKLTGKKKEDRRVVVNSVGSVGIAITKLLLTCGFAHITMCDRSGILSRGTGDLSWAREKIMDVTNLDRRADTLADAMKDADISVGVSASGIVTQDMVTSMNKGAILSAMTNPVPEIMPELAEAAGMRTVGTGRSGLPNQVNNMVVFLGIFKGALEGRASAIAEEARLATAEAITGLVGGKDLSDENVLPEAFGPRMADVVGGAVKDHTRE